MGGRRPVLRPQRLPADRTPPPGTRGHRGDRLQEVLHSAGPAGSGPSSTSTSRPVSCTSSRWTARTWRRSRAERSATCFCVDNFFTAFAGQYNPLNFTQHLWTVAFEEQVYLFIPLLFAAIVWLRRSTPLFALTAAAVVASQPALAMGTHPLPRRRDHRVGDSVSSRRHDRRGAVAGCGSRFHAEAARSGDVLAAHRRPCSWRRLFRAAGRRHQPVPVDADRSSLHAAGPRVLSHRAWMSGPGIVDRLAPGPAAVGVPGTNLVRSLRLALGRQPIRSESGPVLVLGFRESGKQLVAWLFVVLSALSWTVAVSVLSYFVLERPFLRIKSRFTLVPNRTD